MRNPRETIDYYNRKFVVNVTGGLADATGEMDFTMPAINDTTFSSGYNQCLIRIKHIIIANETAALADQINPVFVQTNGAGLSSCNAGIIVRTSFPSRQVKSVSNNYVVARFGEGHDQSFHQLISPECKQTYIRSGTAVDGKVCRGSKQILQQPQSLADPQHLIDDSVNFFEFHDTGSFDDTAVLCGVPFAQSHKLQLRDALNGVVLGGLASGANLANGRNSTVVSIKFEILMLPNPRPQDRVL